MVSALAVFVWRARPRTTLHRLFALQISSFSIWTLGIAGLYNSNHYYNFWGSICFAGASLIPAAFLAFVHHYPPESRWPSRAVIRFTFLIGVLFATMSFVTPWVVVDFGWSNGQLWRNVGPLYPFFATYFLLVWAEGAV